MSNIVNLRRARKTKKRANKQITAAQNRAHFGQTKAQKERKNFVVNQQNQQLDGAKICPPASPPKGEF